MLDFIGSDGVYWALVGLVMLGYGGQGNTAIGFRKVNVKLLPVNTKLLFVNTVVNSKYKQIQHQHEPSAAY